MSSTYSSYKFELIGTGEQAGTWGTTTNTNLGTAIEQAIGGYVSVTFTGLTKTLTLTNSNAAQDARALYLDLTGTPGGAATLEVPAIQKAYIIKNATTGGYTVTVKVTGMTGVAIPNGKTMLVYNNGTDVVLANDNFNDGLTLGTTVLSANSASDALRINQLGAGNAILVEDDTNPDATPFLVSSTGTVISGYTASLNAASAQTGTDQAGGRVQQHGTTTQLGTFFQSVWNTNSIAAPAHILCKANSNTVGTYTAVSANYVLGYLQWQGSDGTGFVRSADIRAIVDNTVSTGVVPSYLNFRVVNAAGTLASRLTISADYGAGFGSFTSSQLAGYALRVAYTLTGDTTGKGIASVPVINTDVTVLAHSYFSYPTLAASATLPALYHYTAGGATLNAGSGIATQRGFSVSSGMTQGTANYGFYSELNAGIGIVGFYSFGSADNIFAGNTRFGSTSTPSATVDVTGTINASSNITSSGSIRSSSATAGIGYTTGAGGTVTQTSSRTNSVAVNALSGAITLVSATTTAGTFSSFTVNNSSVISTDVVIVNFASATSADKYSICVTAVSNFSFRIQIHNIAAVSVAEAPVINFAVIKGVTA